MQRRAVLPALALLILGALGAWYGFSPGPAAIEFQGWVEADYLFIGADAAGRLTALNVKEGQSVPQGEELFALQSDVEEAAWQQQLATLREAKAKLARLEAAQQRPEEIAILNAQYERAKAALKSSKPEFDRVRELAKKGFASGSRLDQSKAAYERDKAALEEIERQIKFAHMTSRAEDITAAREVVRQAEAQVASAKTHRAQRDVKAPASGVIEEVYYRKGEIVPAGRPVVSLLPPGNIKLRFFVPEAMLPRLKAGDSVSIHCDGCDTVQDANIFFISHEAEFTPPVIFSRKERAKLVYRVEARPKHPELLRVGQPVSITLKKGAKDGN